MLRLRPRVRRAGRTLRLESLPLRGFAGSAEGPALTAGLAAADGFPAGGAGIEEPPGPVPEFEIVRVFADALLELTRLLREAANIEHALMVQYLYAAFSLKPRYAELAGDAFESTATVLGIAVQEMRHLARVNELLVELGQEPSLDREDFPIRTDLYPFPLELEPLTRSSLARYVTAEAPAGSLDPSQARSDEDRAFCESVARELGNVPVQHIGSLYGAISDMVREVVQASPGRLADSDRWLGLLQGIRAQGEDAHFLFFKSLFLATPTVFRGQDVWSDPAAEVYPSLPLPHNPTALEGAAGTIADPAARELAWLSDLHYWLTLVLLHRGHFANEYVLIGRAKSHMMGCLHPLGTTLAERGAGLPFDAIGFNVGTGMSRTGTLEVARRLVAEIERVEHRAAADLPFTYSTSVAADTLAAL